MSGLRVQNNRQGGKSQKLERDWRSNDNRQHVRFIGNENISIILSNWQVFLYDYLPEWGLIPSILEFWRARSSAVIKSCSGFDKNNFQIFCIYLFIYLRPKQKHGGVCYIYLHEFLSLSCKCARLNHERSFSSAIPGIVNKGFELNLPFKRCAWHWGCVPDILYTNCHSFT